MREDNRIKTNCSTLVVNKKQNQIEKDKIKIIKRFIRFFKMKISPKPMYKSNVKNRINFGQHKFNMNLPH